MFQTKAKLIKNIEVMPDYYKIVLDAPSIARGAEAGQFINIRVNDKYEPFLRRPFSIHRIRNQKTEGRNQIEIIYKVVGKGTEILSQKKPGERLDILGPLGNGFSLLATSYSLLVAGGMGVFAMQGWWRPVVAGSAAFSAVVLILFWDRQVQMLANKGGIGLLINLAILIALLVVRWPRLGF